MSEAKTITDHEKIRKWVEARDGRPAAVQGTGRGKEPGLLRIDFKPWEDELEPIDWEQFFEKFDKEKLAFLCQDKTEDGGMSRFHKFVERSAKAA